MEKCRNTLTRTLCSCFGCSTLELILGNSFHCEDLHILQTSIPSFSFQITLVQKSLKMTTILTVKRRLSSRL